MRAMSPFNSNINSNTKEYSMRLILEWALNTLFLIRPPALTLMDGRG